MKMAANPGKELSKDIEGQRYVRIPIRTHLIGPGENIMGIVTSYVGHLISPKDIVVISERVVAISQGRAFVAEDIKASRLAKFLARFVYKSPYGIGVGSPETMEMALREVGRFRIGLGVLAGLIGKLVGIRGLFYLVCGYKVRGIDGPCAYTIPPYNKCVVLAPDNPRAVAKKLGEALGCLVAIIDANDLGVNILGISSRKRRDKKIVNAALADNPLGQGKEQTPLGIIRLLTVKG